MTQTERTTAQSPAVDTAPAALGEGSAVPTSHAVLTGELSAVVASLHDSFDVRVGSTVVDAEIQQVADQFIDARIRSYVPLFVRRYAGAALRRRSTQVPTRGERLDAAVAG